MNDAELLKQYAIANVCELKGQLYDRRLITFNWLFEALPTLNDRIFSSEIFLRGEVCEFHNFKWELSRQQIWRRWYLFFDCISFRYESAFPGSYHIPAVCLMRSIGRELNRTDDKSVRQATWRYIRSEFKLAKAPS